MKEPPSHAPVSRSLWRRLWRTLQPPIARLHRLYRPSNHLPSYPLPPRLCRRRRYRRPALPSDSWRCSRQGVYRSNRRQNHPRARQKDIIYAEHRGGSPFRYCCESLTAWRGRGRRRGGEAMKVESPKVWKWNTCVGCVGKRLILFRLFGLIRALRR